MNQSTYAIELLTIIQRLFTNDEKALQLGQLLKNIEAGDYAEDHLYSMLQQNYADAIILTDVYLHQLQIDCLLINSSYCIVMEVKNMKGKIRLTASPRQMLRDDQIFQSPEIQLDRIHTQLSALLAHHKMECPIHCAISFPFHNAEIINESRKYPLLVGRDILHWIDHLPKQQTIAHQEIAACIQQQSRASYQPTMLCNRYNIQPNRIRTGVICPNCKHLPMQRKQRTWYCENCQATSKNAHEQALREYAMLFTKHITNRECMRFLHLRNRYEAKRILQQCSINYVGNTHKSYYVLKF